MKKTLIAMLAVAVVAAPALAGTSRVLQGSTEASGLDKVRLDAGVGDIELNAVHDGDQVTVEVELKPRRGGFFSSMKKAQREVDKAELRMDASRGVLRLEIESESDDRHFEEHWIIELPAHLAFDLELGVGDVQVRDLEGNLNVEIGVGELDATGVSGDLMVEIGVGDASIEASATDYGSVSGSGGVGDAKLTVQGQRVSSSGFVGHSAEWSGSGDHIIEIDVGVGDAKVTLD